MSGDGGPRPTGRVCDANGECSSSSCSELETEAEEGPLTQLLTAVVHESRHNMPDQCFSRELRRELEGIQATRTRKASTAQLAAMAEHMQAHPALAAGISSSLQGRANLETAWKSLAAKLNSMGGPLKTVAKWKQTWRDMRNNVKRRAAHNTSELRGYGPNSTGHGPSTLNEFSQVDEQVLSIMGPVAVYGLEDVACTEILTTLNFLATGSYQKPVGQDWLAPLSQASVSRIVEEIVNALNELLPIYVKFPTTEQERTVIKQGMSPGARTALVSRQDRFGNAPLFVASVAGNVSLVEYLVDVCGAPLEQTGVYRAPREGTQHRATPLWAAAVAGRLPALRALHARGALIDAPSDSGSTPLRSACFMSHADVARYLVTHGADVARANHHGGTCLVNAVQSAPLCRLLLAAGAPVDAQDSQLKTALHYAIEEHREEAARLLLRAGADPALRTRRGDDALQLAAIKGATRLVYELSLRAGEARAADALELLGATQLDVYNSPGAALACWERATRLRSVHRLPKRPVRARAPPVLGAREWTEEVELAGHAEDGGWLRAQALLVVLRVLGPRHHETQFRLMDRGAADVDAGRFARASALWSWVLEQQVRQHTLLSTETMQTLVALTRLLETAGAEYVEGGGGALLPPRAATSALRLLVDALPESARLVSQRPMCRAQAALWERALRCATHLVATAGAVRPLDPREDQLRKECREQTCALVRLQLRSVATGDSLLHLACSRLNVVQSPYFPERTQGLFPSVEVASLLLQCGELASRRNHARSTPLHVAAIPYNFSTELVELLVSWGAHLDQPNRFGDSPSELVQQNPGSRVCPLRHVTLACLAARALMRAPARRAAAAPRLPASLEPFLALHAP